MINQLAMAAYSAFQAMRRLFLTSVFGWMSECKHQPTCGEFTIQVIRSKGPFVGLYQGVKRTLSCW